VRHSDMWRRAVVELSTSEPDNMMRRSDSRILALPYDLLMAIATHLEFLDIASLRLVSRRGTLLKLIHEPCFIDLQVAS
jgi:hypothetical protein